MAQAVQITGPTTPPSKAVATPTTNQAAPATAAPKSTAITPQAPRQIVGPGEMVVIQPARIRTAGQPDVGAPAKRVAPMDVQQRTVKLSTGEYVNRDDFDALNPSQQAYLSRYGIEAFNKEGERIIKEAETAEKEAQAYVERETAKQVKYETENLVKLDNGESVMKQAFDALTPEQQTKLKTLGIDKYNEWVKQTATTKAVTTTPAAGTTTTPGFTQPAGTVALNNGDFVSQDMFNKLTPEEQNKLRTLGVDEYNKAIEQAKAESQQAQQTLVQYAKTSGTGEAFIGPLLLGQERAVSVTGQTILDYLAENKNNPQALATVRAAGYDISTKDPKTGKSLLDLATQVVTDREKASREFNTALSTGKGVQAVVNAIEDAGYYDNTKLNASLKLVGMSGPYWVDNTTGKLLTNQDIAQRIWDTLTPQEKNRVIDTYGADVYKGNYFSEYIKEMSQVASEAGIVGQLVYGPILAMATPIAKVAVNQPVSATEWAVGGATAVVTIATLGLAPELGGVPGLIARGVTTAAAGTLTGIGIQQTISNWGEMKTPERVAAVALDVVGLVGTALAGYSTFRQAQTVIQTHQTTQAAIRAGNAYNNMVRTVDAANAEAAQKGLVSAQTVTKVQEAIAASRAADTEFLARFGKIGQASVKTLNKFEKASGYRGLSQAVQDLNTARKALNAAWDNVALQTDPIERVKALTQAQIARDKFFNALNRTGEITTPRTKPVPSIVWDDVIDVTKADLQRVQTAYKREAARVETSPFTDKSYLQELKQNIDVLNENLRQYEQARASGEWRGAPGGLGSEAEVARAQMRVNYFEQAAERQGLTPEEFLAIQDQLDLAKADLARAQEWLAQKPIREAEFVPQDLATEFKDFTQGTGKYSPEFQAKQRLADEANARIEKSFYDKNGYWPSPSGPRYPSNQPGGAPIEKVTTAGRVATEVKPTETQMSLNMLLEDVLSQPTAAEPRVSVGEVVPKAGVTVPAVGTPKMLPLLVVAPAGLAGQAVAAQFIADLTPEQFEAMYGEKVKVAPADVQAAQIVSFISGASVPKVQGATWVSPEEAIKIAEATRTGTLVQIGIDAMQQAASKVMIATDNEEAIKQAQQQALKTYLETITNPALRDEVAAEIQGLTSTEVETRIKAATEPATRIKPAVETETRTQVKAATKSEVTPKVRTEIIPKEVTPIRPIPIIPIIPPILPSTAVKKRKGGKIYPAGTVVWKQGYMWKVVPPPYNVKKPISTRTAPVGVTVFEGTPQETLTFIGGVVPFADISFDLGVVDGYIDVKAKKIVFTGGGLKTEFGERIPSPTVGVTITATPAAKARAIEREQRLALGMETKTRRKIPKRTVLKHDKLQTLVQSGS